MKNLTWQNPEQLFVAQELINKVKSKCCGIKDHRIHERERGAGMIELFHTSPQKITEPDTRHSRTNLDFGRGFYLTSFKDQAIRYAGRFSDRYDTI